MPHLKYLKYVLIHKWHVFRAGWALGVPLWALIAHDWSKFLPSEWSAYVDHFYGASVDDKTREAFDNAWNHHQKAQPHHWQYWLLITDNDNPRIRPLVIPARYVREMVADWIGAGRALGKPDAMAWYEGARAHHVLHEHTRALVEEVLREAQQRGLIP
jgi:hypothetical protein